MIKSLKLIFVILRLFAHYWKLLWSEAYRQEQRKKLEKWWYVYQTISKAAAISQVGRYPMQPCRKPPFWIRLDSKLLSVAQGGR